MLTANSVKENQEGWLQEYLTTNHPVRQANTKTPLRTITRPQTTA